MLRGVQDVDLRGDQEVSFELRKFGAKKTDEQ